MYDAQIRVKTKLDNSDLRNFGEELKENAKTWASVISNVVSRLKTLAVGLIAVKALTSGIAKLTSMTKEGLQNLAHYSKEYNKTMSDLYSQAAMLKNNLGAAFEPIMNTIIPYLTMLVSWLNAAAEKMSMFLSVVISGKTTYTKAKNQVVDYAKAITSAGAAAKKALASFDELNVLTQKSGGSGELTGSNAFEEAEINPETLSMLQNIKKLLEEIAPYATMIGAIFLGWKIGAALASLGIIGGILGGVLGSAIAIYNYFKMWEGGVNWKNLAGFITGVVMAVTALTIACGPLVGGIALLIFGVAGLVMAIKDMNENGLTAQNVFLGLFSVVAITIAGIMLFGTAAGLALGAVSALTLGIVALCQNWNKMSAAQQAITILGALAAALTTAAVAVAIFHTCWTVGVAAAAIAAGLALLGLTAYFTSGKELEASSDKVSGTIPKVAQDASKLDYRSSTLPALADGAVIQGGSPFMAWLGDQPSGQTNIEAPLSTIKQALVEALQQNGGAGDISLNVNLDGEVVYKNVIKRDRQFQRAHGGVSAFS